MSTSLYFFEDHARLSSGRAEKSGYSFLPLFIVIVFFALSFTVMAQTMETRPAYNTGTGFFMKNAKMYDANGVEFIPIGYNGTVYWQDETCMKNSLDDVARTGANAIRLVQVTPATANNWSWGSRPENHRAIVASSVANNLVPMLEFHDATCGTTYDSGPEEEQLVNIVDYWCSPAMVQLCKDYEKQLIVNIANEWGGERNIIEWKDSYKLAISRMRAAGIKNMLVIDAGGNCGQNPNSIITYAQEIINSDPEKNVVFSIHMYTFWYSGTLNAASWRFQVEAKLQEFKSNNIPVMVGEFGWEGTSSVTYDPRVVMSKTAELGYGWFYWVWFDQPEHVNYFGIVKDPCVGYNTDADLSISGAAIVNGANGVRARSRLVSMDPPTDPGPGPNYSKVTGTTFGTPASKSCATCTYDKVFDNNTSTYFDAAIRSGGYTGIDAGSAKVVTRIRFYPRSGRASRMTGGIFQGSNTSSSTGFVDLYTIPSTPTQAWSQIDISNTTGYRYIRYVGPNAGYCNVAEVEFYVTATPAARFSADEVNTNATTESNEKLNLKVYPNPVTDGKLNINVYSKVRGNGSISLINALGAKVVNNSVSVVEGDNTFQISTAGLQSGLYIFAFEQGWVKVVKKVYINK